MNAVDKHEIDDAGELDGIQFGDMVLVRISRKADIMLNNKLTRTYACTFTNGDAARGVVLRIKNAVVRKVGVKQALIDALAKKA